MNMRSFWQTPGSVKAPVIGLGVLAIALIVGSCAPQPADHEPGPEARAISAEPAAAVLVPASVERPSADGSGDLRITQIGVVAPDIISLTLRAGTVVPGEYVPYVEQAGDRVERAKRHRTVHRDGVFLGTLVGREESLLRTPDRLAGKTLPDAVDTPNAYSISSTDDQSFVDGLPPSEVGRKTKPVDIALDPDLGWVSPTESTLYLSLPRDLRPGASYQISFELDDLAPIEFTYDVDQLKSEAIHVSQIGFRPDDPVKVAFLSTWMGTSGPLDYPDALGFSIVDVRTGKAAFDGQIELAKARDEPEDASGRNFNSTDVYVLAFDELTEPGEFVVQVDRVGRSEPFRIGDDVWQRAFYVAARGFYHQRSGIELGPPYTEFRRPRPFHPDDGVKVLQSSCPLMNSGNGLNYAGGPRDNFACLVDGKLDEIVPDAWGGYMDAGDWDRRIQHLRSSNYLLELAELFPEHFEATDLDIPESGSPWPDVVSEALFNIDFYRRLQTADGGIRGGIESSDHPRRGEASWQDSLEVMAYAPGVWSSYGYAGAAARAAFVLRRYDPQVANGYEQSAIAAMQYAESHAADLGEPKAQADGVIDARNQAAAELYRLTGDGQWHDIFLATTVLGDPSARLSRWPEYNQADAAWIYLRTVQPGVDAEIQEHGRQAILREADLRVTQGAQTGFGWTKNPWSGAAWGAFAVPDGVEIARAHYMTGESAYLRALILASQHGAGANPLNMSYTTGLGGVGPQHPLHIDSRMTGQPPPPGITVFGPLGFKEAQGQWGQSLADPFLYPPFEAWPTLEAYWDIYAYGPMNEYSIHGSMTRTAYVWGYLAAAPRQPAG